MVTEKLRQHFLREPSRAVDPDMAVALGAAVQAAMIDGDVVQRVLVDVATHTLGIEVCRGFSPNGLDMAFAPIIHRNSPLSARYEESFSKMHEHQQEGEVHVLQGEHQEVERNRSIGTFRLDVRSSNPNRSKDRRRY